MKIVAETGLSWHAVNNAIKLHKAEDATALMPKARGKKLGDGRVFTQAQEIELCEILATRGAGRQVSMWNRQAVMQRIEEQCGIKLSVRAVGNYLYRWGFVLKYPDKRPYDRCTNDMKNWLDSNYATIEQQAKLENARIYWLSKASIQIPLLEKDTSEFGKSNEKLLMNAVVSNQGKIHWRIQQGKFDQEAQIKFLKAVSKVTKHKIILIKDDARIYSTEQVLEWLSKNADKIKVYPDPTICSYRRSDKTDLTSATP